MQGHHRQERLKGVPGRLERVEESQAERKLGQEYQVAFETESSLVVVGRL